MSFVKLAKEPPDVKEGEILKARITNISKGTSKWKDEQGNPKDQLEFDLELEDGYKFKSWMAFYDQPSEKSKMGKLALKLQETTGKELNNAEDFLVALKSLGQVYVKCKNFREYEDIVYPNFTILTEKMPKKQQQAKVIEEQPATSQQPLTQNQTSLKEKTREIDAKQLLSRFKDAIEMGLPLNEKDFNSNLLVEERIFLFKHAYVERRQDLFYFTANTQQLFPQQPTV
mgnify:CR=1 FL=1